MRTPTVWPSSSDMTLPPVPVRSIAAGLVPVRWIISPSEV